MGNDAFQYDDQFCLLKMREGEEKFFNLLFERYRNRLFIFLLKITKSKEAAEEIVLDVFLKLWQGKEVVSEIENLEGFLYRVAYHKAVDFFRAAKRSPAIQKEIWDRLSVVASYDTADERLFKKELEGVLKTAIHQLPQQRQKVYYLRNIEGLSYSDIAHKLNLSHHTVRNHLAASVEFIRKFLLKNDIATVLLASAIKIFF